MCHHIRSYCLKKSILNLRVSFKNFSALHQNMIQEMLQIFFFIFFSNFERHVFATYKQVVSYWSSGNKISRNNSTSITRQTRQSRGTGQSSRKRKWSYISCVGVSTAWRWLIQYLRGCRVLLQQTSCKDLCPSSCRRFRYRCHYILR